MDTDLIQCIVAASHAYNASMKGIKSTLSLLFHACLAVMKHVQTMEDENTCR